MTDRRLAPGARLALALAATAALVALAWPPRGVAPRVAVETLLAPFAPGREVARGYVLSPPRRGEEHDVVLVARRAATDDAPDRTIQVHVVDRGRWAGVRETASFGVAWELPRSSAPREDSEAVTAALADVLRAHDPGGATVDSLALRAEAPPPWIARALTHLAGPRAVLAGALLALAALLAITLRGGSVALGVGLFALGLWLRAAALGLPFVHDQDIQRLRTGHLSLRAILTGEGLDDRHPPLYFVVLHAAERFGTSEAVARLPAVLAGALLAPAVLFAARVVRGRVGPLAALAACGVCVAPALVARAREVSEIPLFALLALIAAAALARALERPSRGTSITLGGAVALALWTYYTAVFLVAGLCAGAVWTAGRPPRRTLRALGLGVLAGAPSLALAVRIYFRDRGARAAAARFPGLAWGQHSAWEVLRACAAIAGEALSLPGVAAFIVVTALAVKRRDPAVAVAACGALASWLGVALLAPVARVQPYYVVTVLPLAALAVALAQPAERALRVALCAALCAGLAGQLAPGLARAGAMYVPDVDAFGPAFAQEILARPAPRVVAVAHYDATLLSYYVARAAGVSLDWRVEGDEVVLAETLPRVVGLAAVHGLDERTVRAAVARFRALRAQSELLVVDRHDARLPGLDAELRGCDVALEAPSARLLRCPQR